MFGFSRKDIAKQLSDFAKKDLIANYPQGATNPAGISEFVSGRQSAVDPEIYLFYSDVDIPAANKVESPENPNDFKWECGVAGSPQRVYKPKIRSDSDYNVIGQEVDAVRVSTFDDLAGSTNYASASYFVYNPWDTPIKSNEIGICAVIGGVLFAFQRPPKETGRIRFRLYTGFTDDGTASATVLDSWGDDTLCAGDSVDVYDPRKLFAHAVGSTSFSALHQYNTNIDDMLHAGGSVGYAVETFKCEYDPFDVPTTCGLSSIDYPRYEVEQCTQSANKMRVFIDDYPAFPKGTGSTEYVDLKVFPDQSFVSEWPYVDFPEALTVESGPVYRISCLNARRFSAKTGWAIVERVSYASRLQNAANRCVPYVGALGSRTEEWHIVDVENPIARYICVTYQASGSGSQFQESWNFSGTYFEGENPSDYFQNGINDSIATAPCLDVDCMSNGEPGLAFWDPNDQKYYVFATESALYGRAKDYEVVGQRADAITKLIEYGTDCQLKYRTAQYIKVFGDKTPQCEADFPVNLANPNLTAVDVVSDVTRGGSCYIDGTVDPTHTTQEACDLAGGVWVPSDELCFDKKQVFVCKNEDLPDECVNICCDVTPPEPPPASPCINCSMCPDSPIQYRDFQLAWSGVPTGNGNFGGRHVNDSVVWAQVADCCAVLTVEFESDDPLIANQVISATVCIVQKDPAVCAGTGFWQLDLVWGQATYAGVTLPVTMCGGLNQTCAGSYGMSGGAGVVPASPNATAGTWDEGTINIASCEP